MRSCPGPLKSATPYELQFIDFRGIRKTDTDGACVFCGYQHGPVRVEDAHHPLHRGRFGASHVDRIPAFAAEGFGNNARIDGLPGLTPCHALLHFNGGGLVIQPPIVKDGVAHWYATADERACACISVRRALARWDSIAPSEPFFIGSEVR